jgi:xanthine dehydrogenase YagS FAD-binding subunit
MRNFEHVNVTSIASAIKNLEGNYSLPIAGGTDLITQMKSDILRPERLVNLKEIPGLKDIRFDESSGLEIGALATLAEIAGFEMVERRYPVLLQSISAAASPQIRNSGTIGGNLNQGSRCWYYRGPFHCWLKGGEICYARQGENEHHAIFRGGPCYTVQPSDPAIALVALNSKVRIRSKQGERIIPLDQFFQKPKNDSRQLNILKSNEFITGLTIPLLDEGSRGIYLKAMSRRVWSFALVSVAAQLSFKGHLVKDARLVLGGVSAVPWLVSEAASTLQNQKLDDNLIDDIANLSVKDAHPLSKNAYKIPLIKGLVKEALNSLRL